MNHGPKSRERLAADLVATRRRLSAAEERFAALYDNIPLMYFTLNPDRSVRSVNREGAHELGWEPDDLIGRSVLEVFHPDDRTEVARQLREVLETPGRVARWEFRKIRQDGASIWVRESACAVRTKSGEMEILVACQDVTEQKEAELRLKAQDGRLRRLTTESVLREERERWRVATGLHDDIAGVLTGALRGLRELRESPPREHAKSLMVDIEARIAKAIESTRSLTFELSSPILHELGLELAIRDLVERIACRQGMRFRFRTDGQTRRLTDDAAISLFRVVRELLSNVEQHSGASTVNLAVATVDGKLVIRVEDDGRGFDSAAEYEGHAANRGFGLFSVRVQLQELGGCLEVDSIVGGGTRSVVTAPLPPQRSRPSMASSAIRQESE